MTVHNAKNIYDTLKVLGLSRAQARKILPDWWSPEAEKHPDGVAELALLLSRRLYLDFSALMRGEVKKKDSALLVAYKHRADATLESLNASTYIATSLAHAVVSAMPRSYNPILPSLVTVERLARKIGNGVVSLRSLIDCCWEMGIPIIPIPNLPVGIRKMDGAVMKVADRPVIIISKKKSSRAWLAFIVGHEIAHIGCGHLAIHGTIVDVSLQEHVTYQSESSTDDQESEADNFALSLLGGSVVDDIISTWPTWASAVDLAVRARESAKLLGVESGHIILRYAFYSKRWSDAMTALRFLSEDADAESVIKERLQSNLNLDLVADDLRDLVCRLTGISGQ